MNEHRPSAAAESDVELYTRGSCHAFAIALHRHLGMALLVVTDPASPYDEGSEEDEAIPGVVHVLALDGNGSAWDVLGSRPLDAVREEVLSRHPDVPRVAYDCLGDEDGMVAYVDGTGDDPDLDRPLHALADTDVDEAWECARRVLGAVPGFPEDRATGPR